MRRRIVLLAAGTALLAVIVLSIPLGVLAGRTYLHDERLELQQAAATAAARARGDVATSGVAPLADSGEIAVSVYNPMGRRVAGPGPAAAPDTVRTALAGRAASTTTDSAITVAAPVSDGDQVVAALLLTASLDSVHRRTTRAWLLLGAMDTTAVLIAASAAILLSRRLTRPIDQLATVAARVGDGDLTARGRSSGVAEIDTLAATLNDTVDRVQAMIARERGFSAEVSHQLRTPLSGLRLQLEAALAERTAGDQDGSEGREAPGQAADARNGSDTLRGALLAVDRLEATITDVIALARDLPTPQQVEVRILRDTATAKWHGPLAAAGRPLRWVEDPDAPVFLDISRAAASQILDVLLDNAYRHGRGAVSVQVKSASPGLASVEVSNEEPPLTVEPWQLFATRADGNPHGLGLPYARRLAEAEGARLIVADTNPPTFSLTTRVPESGRHV